MHTTHSMNIMIIHITSAAHRLSTVAYWILPIAMSSTTSVFFLPMVGASILSVALLASANLLAFCRCLFATAFGLAPAATIALYESTGQRVWVPLAVMAGLSSCAGVAFLYLAMRRAHSDVMPPTSKRTATPPSPPDDDAPANEAAVAAAEEEKRLAEAQAEQARAEAEAKAAEEAKVAAEAAAAAEAQAAAEAAAEAAEKATAEAKAKEEAEKAAAEAEAAAAAAAMPADAAGLFGDDDTGGFGAVPSISIPAPTPPDSAQSAASLFGGAWSACFLRFRSRFRSRSRCRFRCRSRCRSRCRCRFRTEVSEPKFVLTLLS